MQDYGGAFQDCTQQQAILRGCVSVLENCSVQDAVELRTNYRNLVNGIYLANSEWRSRSWKSNARTNVKYEDLWRQLLTECRRFPITARYVEGEDSELARLAALVRLRM